MQTLFIPIPSFTRNSIKHFICAFALNNLYFALRNDEESLFLQLTLQTDYTLRVLIYLAIKNETLATIEELAHFYNISAHHLTRIIHKLGELGYIITLRGRGGGFHLSQNPKDINIGEVIEKIENHFYTVECFDPEKKTCKLLGACLLQPLLAEATKNFISTLKQKTLADLLVNENKLKQIIKN